MCYGSSILSADFVGQLNHAHKSRPTLSFVCRPLNYYYYYAYYYHEYHHYYANACCVDVQDVQVDRATAVSERRAWRRASAVGRSQ